MTDQLRKTATIRSIQKLQLPNSLIVALEDAVQAESVAQAVEQLLDLNQHWN
ncbi:hypothetical protein G9F31_05125 [Acinetobacter sp. 187]|uniref:Uncharacterized protein n=1 Tax=Acinetobacter lanii TaxID=2715163 RepID=A0A6G8S0H8_9GAMM|nr:hypothetical protein [Acinetobacter lanii]NHC03152.1 hypothetical protein [Acinetobacter lanii]QIO07615.1 hypothetical protein G8D99_00300 [Acinetobacter lanii]